MASKPLNVVLYESRNFVIINKTYDLKINSNDTNEETLQTFMRLNYPGHVTKELHHEFYFMHRLDYSTSGVICIPLHKKACQIASRAIEHRKCKKYYLALVRGWLQPHILDLKFPIGPDLSAKDIQKMRVCNEDSRSARTVIVPIQKGLYDGDPATKLLIMTVTGRRHQIRVHCSHIGHTIIGDYTYSNKTDTKPIRMFLHALRLIIPNEMESLDVRTEDPFVEQTVEGWKPTLDLYSFEEGYRQLDLIVEREKIYKEYRILEDLIASSRNPHHVEIYEKDRLKIIARAAI